MLRAASELQLERTANRVYDWMENLERQISANKASIATQLQQAKDTGNVSADDVRATVKALPEDDALEFKDRLRAICVAGGLTLKSYLQEG